MSARESDTALELLIDSVSRAIDKEKNYLSEHKLKIKQIDLQVQTKTEYEANGGFKIDLVIALIKVNTGDTFKAKEGTTQTMSLSLTPKPEAVQKVEIDLDTTTNELIGGIEAISEAVAESASLMPSFYLNEAKVELNFDLIKDAEGNISFVVVAGGSVSKDKSNTITITLIPE